MQGGRDMALQCRGWSVLNGVWKPPSPFEDRALPPPSFVCCWEPRPSPLAGCDREGLRAEMKLGVQLLLTAHLSTWLTVGSSLNYSVVEWDESYHVQPC